jgi:hypothetical protein
MKILYITLVPIGILLGIWIAYPKSPDVSTEISTVNSDTADTTELTMPYNNGITVMIYNIFKKSSKYMEKNGKNCNDNEFLKERLTFEDKDYYFDTCMDVLTGATRTIKASK